MFSRDFVSPINNLEVALFKVILLNAVKETFGTMGTQEWPFSIIDFDSQTKVGVVVISAR